MNKIHKNIKKFRSFPLIKEIRKNNLKNECPNYGSTMGTVDAK